MQPIGRQEVVAYLQRMANRCQPGDRPWLFHAALFINRDADTVITCHVPGCLTCPPIAAESPQSPHEERHGDQAI